jgi:hypothetical protein
MSALIPVDVGEKICKGIEPRLGSVIATCPECGGRYCCGYLRPDAYPPGANPDEPFVVIRHTAPACPGFMANARTFLSRANSKARDRRPVRGDDDV